MDKLILLVLCAWSFSLPSVKAGPASTEAHQRITLYSEFDQKGRSLVITRHYIDLGGKGWENTAKSVCVNGTWLLYDLPKFNENNPKAPMEWVKGQDFCTNLKQTAGRVCSLRFAGIYADYNQTSLTLYPQEYFGGSLELLQADTAALRRGDSASSLIITGTSAWTLYNEKNYTGSDSVCLVPLPNGPVTSALITDVKEVPWKINFKVGSVRKGCFAKRLISVPTA